MQVHIAGQARNYDAVLIFVKALTDKKAFSNAFLSSHVINDTDPYQPVDFTVEATWITH